MREREVEGGRGGERGRRNWEGMERKMEDYDDEEKDSSRDGWMDDGGKVDFGITLCGIGMNMNGLMLE